MTSKWNMQTDIWSVKVQSFDVLGPVGKFRMALYSCKTGWLSDVSLIGAGLGVGGNLMSEVGGGKWSELECQRFCPGDLHGAPGTLKFGGAGFISGGTVISGSALFRPKYGKGYLFYNADFSQWGADLGISAGHMRGIWQIRGVWSAEETTVPEITHQAIESVGGG